MGAGIEFYLADDVTSASTPGFTVAASGGVRSTSAAFHVWLDKTLAIGGTMDDLTLRLQIQDPLVAGSWLDSSSAIPQFGHFSIRLTGSSSIAGLVPVTTDWQPFGPGMNFDMPRMVSNAYRTVEVSALPPIWSAAATTSAVTWRVIAEYGRPVYDRAVSTALAEGDGIYTGVGSSNVSEWVAVPVLTATGTPDAYVNSSRHWGVIAGKITRREKNDAILLNQNDSAAAALTTGQSYRAILVRYLASGALTAIKGVKATTASVVDPLVPAGVLVAGRVTVPYGAGGSVIGSSAISTVIVPWDGRFSCKAGTGLNLLVGGGRAGIGTAYIRKPYQSTIALTASSTCRVWLVSSGGFVVVTADNNPPSAGALWLSTVVTGASTITSVTDKREGCYIEPRAFRFRLMGPVGTDEAVNALISALPVSTPLQVDRTYGGVRLASSGATGSTRIVCYVRGQNAALFQETATPESRSVVAAQARVDDGNSWPGIVQLGAGDVLELGVDQITTAGTRCKDVWLTVVAYPLAS